jgi:hypothetical protein
MAIRPLSLFNLHRLISELDWTWVRSPSARHPIIRNRHGAMFEVIKAAPDPNGKALLLEPYQPLQTFKDDLF